jgi:hypothetical protein
MSEPRNTANPGHVPQDRERKQPSRAAQRICDARDSLPGQRDALPQGSLRELPPDPQGDENREPVKPPMPPP